MEGMFFRVKTYIHISIVRVSLFQYFLYKSQYTHEIKMSFFSIFA